MHGYGFALLSRKSFVVVAALVAASCGGSNPSEIEPDPAVEPFVGDWDASKFEVTSDENPYVSFDVTDGGSFTINIQPSGGYTAILDFPDLPEPVVEIGQMRVVGNSVTLRPQGGPAATSSYSFDGPNRLLLTGPTKFDFNADGELEDAEAEIVLDRVSG